MSVRKAIIAIAFAGGILNPPSVALSEPIIDLNSSVVRQIAKNESITPELRAYNLLRLANTCLVDQRGRAAIEDSFKQVAQQTKNTFSPFQGRWGNLFTHWVESLAADGRIINSVSPTAQMKSPILPPKIIEKNIPDESKTLAKKAILEAISQLTNVSDEYVKLNLYFVASRLSKKIGMTETMRECDAILETAFKSCEGKTSVSEQKLKAAASVLSTMSYGALPIRIPEYKQSEQAVTSFEEKDFKESERLKLRAAAISDRLETQTHERRMAHRNLALWYMKLGKVELADKQKEILFRLIGIEDDSILYPESRGCGRVTWWQKHSGIGATVGCGMG